MKTLSLLSKTTLSLLVCFGAAAAQADVINVTGADNGDPLDGTSDLGALSLTTRIVSGAQPQDMVYTVSDLNIDGVGVSNDSVEITFTGTTDGGAFSAPTIGYLSTGGSLMDVAGEYVQLTFSNLSVNLNGGTNNGSGSFDGFTSVSLGGWGASEDQAQINSVSYSYDTHPSSDVSITGNTMKVENVGGSMRLQHWDFQISVVFNLPTLPTIDSFTATPLAIDAGDTVTLAWSTADADTLTIVPGIGDVTGTTSTQIIVNAATTYYLIAQNTDGSTTSTVPVFINQQTVPQKPNILYVYADDLGWGSLTANSGAPTLTKTPTIDSLATSGINFRRAYGGSVCSPARSSQQTGFHQGHTWADRNNPAASKAIRADDQTIGDRLNAAGYRVGYYGKWGYGADKDWIDPAINNPQTLPVNHGYTDVLAEFHHLRAHTFFQESLWFNNIDTHGTNTILVYNANTNGQKKAYVDDLYAEAAETFIRTHATNAQPFFCLAAFQIPHTPLDEIEEMPGWFAEYDDVDTSSWSNEVKQFAAMVTRQDGHVASLIAALDDPNGDGNHDDSIRTNTLIIFASDNGGQDNFEAVVPFDFFESNGNLKGAKASIDEGGIRVPTIFHWPGVIATGQSDRITCVSDVLPTLCDLAGILPPAGIDGVSIAPYLTGEGHQRDRGWFQHESNAKWSLIRKDGYKLVDNGELYYLADGGNTNYESVDLLSDTNDPMYSTYVQIAAEMQAIALAEEADEPDEFANTYHHWIGPDGSDMGDAANWSDYVYENNGTNYISDSGTPRESWSATLANTGSVNQTAVLNTNINVLGIDIAGNTNAWQILSLEAGNTLTGRNEIRLSPYAEVQLNGGTLASVRWVDLLADAVIEGSGTIDAILYNAGTLDTTSTNAGDPILAVTGDYHQSTNGLLIGWVGAGTSLVVTGTTYLDGELQCALPAGFSATNGEHFTLISASAVTGTFSNADDMVDSEGHHFQIHYSSNAVELEKVAPALSTGIVVGVTGVDNGDPLNGSSDSGTLSLTTRIVSGAQPQDMVYTISDLDIDGVGGSNDSVDITFTGTTDGGAFSAPTAGYLSTGGSTLDQAGEYVQLTFSNLSVNLNGGTNNASGSFDGFTSVNVGSWNASGDEALINGVPYSYDTHPSKDFPIMGNSMKVEHVSGSMRPATWDFQLTLGTPAPTLPTILSLTATPSEIDPGDTVTVAWATADADTLTLQPGIGDVTGLTSTQLVVHTATTFSLIAQNAEGSVTSSVSVSLLLHPPSILSFTAIDLGSMIELAWETTGADALSINQGVGDVTGLTSTQVADMAVSSYTLTATHSDGSVSAKANVHAQAATNSPNVVFILVDDWGWTDHSSTNAAQGNQSLYFQTPNFDRLAESGVALTSTYTQPNCAPTRAALISGQYSCRVGNGVYNVTTLNRSSGNTTYTTAADQGDEHVNGDEQTITIGEAFLNSGYVTAHFGKYHAGESDPTHPTHPLNQGYDFNYGGQNDGNPGSFFALETTPRTFHEKVGPELDAFAEDYDLAYITHNLVPFANGNDPTTLVGTKKHLTDAMADAFESFMNNHRSGSLSNYPVYVQFHYYAVHSPIQPRSDLLAKYQAITPPAESTHDNRPYAALVEGMDHTLGRIVAYLDDPDGDGNNSDSIADNTLIVFLSDNGGWSTVTTDNAPLRDFKGSHFEGGIRVPCVVRMPGTIPTNKVSDALIHCVDFYPTMLDFAGGVYPDATHHPLDGVSLYDHLLDPDGTARHREPIFFHFPGYLDTRAYASSAAIKDVDGKRFKYIYSYDPYYGPSAANDQYQLYNLTDDISETVNLLDYIDLENAADPGDPSTPEEYWNYILYKATGDELSSDLREWLIGDPADTTWQPIHVTYKATYPGIDPGQVGQPVDLPPANIPTLVAPANQQFRVRDVAENGGAGELAVVFNSATGFVFSVQASSNLVDWVDLTNGIPGQSGWTTNVVNDPAFDTETRRYYRAGVTDE